MPHQATQQTLGGCPHERGGSRRGVQVKTDILSVGGYIPLWSGKAGWPVT